jgi:hypothetical protein
MNRSFGLLEDLIESARAAYHGEQQTQSLISEPLNLDRPSFGVE